MSSTMKNAHFLALQQAFDAPWPGPAGDAITLKNSNIEITVYPQDAARMTSLRVFNYELLRQWNSQRRAFQYGSFPLVPWVGRLGNGQLEVNGKIWQLPVNKPPHALHGMACYSEWDIVEQTADSLTLRMMLKEPWPWKGHVIQQIALQDDAVIMQLDIHSDGEIFPASAGWHPWFAKWINAPQDVTGLPIDEALQLRFMADWQEEPGNNELPTGRHIAPGPGPWDDCFGFNHGISVRLEWPEKIALDISSPSPGLVVFDKQPDATCVNPLTQAPNAINISPEYVTPGKPLTIKTRWQFSRL